MFIDFIDVALVKSHIVYLKLGNDISLLNLKIAVAKALIGRYSNIKNHPCPRKVSNHMVELQRKRMRFHYCNKQG